MSEQAKVAGLLRDISAVLGVPTSAFFGGTDLTSPQSTQFQQALSALARAFARTHDAEQRALCIAALWSEVARLKKAKVVCDGRDGGAVQADA